MHTSYNYLQKTSFQELQCNTRLIFWYMSMLHILFFSKKVFRIFFFCIFLVINFLYISHFLKNSKHSVSLHFQSQLFDFMKIANTHFFSFFFSAVIYSESCKIYQKCRISTKTGACERSITKYFISEVDSPTKFLEESIFQDNQIRSNRKL